MIGCALSKALLALYATAGSWPLAYDAASTALSLVPLLTARSLSNSDKQHLLVDIVGLASDAAAVALMANQPPYEAIRLLELGRGVIASSLNELRADTSYLQQEHPKLAQEYVELRGQLDAPKASARQIGQSNIPSARERQVNQRYNAAQKLERMIEDIRALPGFERFLLAPTEDELKAAAAAGPVVIINVSDYRCDALIIDKHGFQALPLARLQSGDVRARATTLANPDMIDTSLLEWLWDTIAEPVLDTLGFTKTPGDSWPRIWWIPPGRLRSFLSMQPGPATLLSWTGSSHPIAPLSERSCKAARGAPKER